MKTIKILSTLLLVALYFTACQKDELTENTSIQISGIEFSPYSFTEDGTVKGIDVDIASSAMNSAGIDMEINIQESWEDAYNATLNGSNRALLSVGYSEERKDLFKWAGPTSLGSYCIFSKKETGVGAVIGIEGAKQIASVAVVSEWLETITLEELGFTNLVYFDSYDKAIQAFINNDVKSIASDFFHFTENLPAGINMQEEIDICCSYRTSFYYIAFSKDVDDKIVEQCQSAIDALIESENTLSITQKYINYATKNMTPSQVYLFTEIAMPFNYFQDTENMYVNLAGSSVDIINELQSKNTYVNPIRPSSWIDAYNVVQYLPNSALFTVARTPERENLFQWVGPIATLRACFYTRTNSGIQIETLEDAKTLSSIATPQGWYTHEYLLNHGFDNIVATSFSPVDAFEQLISGEVDALLIYDLGVNWLCESTEVPLSSINEQFEIDSYKGYIAFSLNTSESIVQKWQNKLDVMKNDGTFQNIWETWYGDTEMP